MSSEPLVESAYGLGQVVRLYPDHLDVNGKVYGLTSLTRVRPCYHRLFGVKSARIELHFDRRKIILRGMPDVEVAACLVAHLNRRLRAGGMDDRYASRRTRHPEERLTPASAVSSSPRLTPESQQSPEISDSTNNVSPVDMRALIADSEVPRWATRYQEQRIRRQQRLQLERVRYVYGFDITQAFRRLEGKQLPVITIPMSLMPGEEAHYITDAMLCGQERASASHKRYVPSDHGKLILTSERMIYLGRKSQIVLAYTQLLHVTRLYDAIAFTAEHWARQEIFAVRYPLECAMYLERVLESWQLRQEEQGGSAPLALKQAMTSLERDLARLPDAEELASIARPRTEKRVKASFKERQGP